MLIAECFFIPTSAICIQRVTFLHVEHFCHKCGASVEDGAPFCPKCSAPQIRVNAATPPLPPGTPGDAQPPAQPVPLRPMKLQSSATLPAALMAGVVMGLLSLIPVVSIGCCLWMLLGGIFAVRLYQNRAPGLVTGGMGARLGALSGLFGFIVYALGFAAQIGFGRGEGLKSEMIRQLHEAAAKNSDPNAQQVAEKLATPEGIVMILIIGLVAFLFGFLVFGSIGGAVGAAIFGKRQQNAR